MLGRLSRRIANQRKDTLQQLTTKLANAHRHRAGIAGHTSRLSRYYHDHWRHIR